MSDTGIQADPIVLEEHDWSLSCEWVKHHLHGAGAATLALWSHIPKLCGCPPKRDFMYLCDGCWNYLVPRLVKCERCLDVHPFKQTIARAERL